MKRYEGILAGILSTVIIHLLAAILFISLQLNSLERDMAREYLIYFEQPEPEPADKPEPIMLPEMTSDRLSDVDQKIRNIIRNLSNQENPVIDPDEYQDRVKEEMVRAGTLNEKNFIDEWKNKSREEGEIKVEVENKDSVAKSQDEIKKINFQGATRVYYNLPGREHRNLPIPVYKCEGGGKVTVSIEVDNDGIVVSAKVLAGESSTQDICLLETAVQSALVSSFNKNASAPKRQPGTITFHFVEQ